MDERMRTHIEKLFENAPKTRKAIELKEELLANSEERYQDLVADGATADDAFKHVISSIGNVSELFRGLEEAPSQSREEYEAQLHKVAVVKTAAVGLYILGAVVFFASGLLDGYVYSSVNITFIGFILMLLIASIPTCMLVYVGSRYPRYKKTADTVVEDFKEWKSDSLKKKSVKNASLLVAWTFVILIYFAVSFLTFAWYATWIIFLAGACIHAIIELMFRVKEMKN